MKSPSRILAVALSTTLALTACDESGAPLSSPHPSRAGASGAIVSQSFPITWPSGIANDGLELYVTTLDGFRPWYEIDPAIPAVVRAIPGDFNPRDVVYMLGRGFAMSDVGGFVAVRRSFDGMMIDSIPIPWRGGGIAHWRDTLYVGDLDTDSILVLHYPLAPPAAHPVIRKFASPVRAEGLVADSTMAIASTSTLWAITPFDSLMYEMDLQGNLLRKCFTPYRPGPYGLGGVTLLRDTFFIAHPKGGDPTAGTTIVRVAKSELVCVGPTVVVNDTIDIDPGHFPNRINPHSNAKIKVVALTVPGRDATTLIPATVRFGRTGTEAPAIGWAFYDADGDGDIDAVFEFKVGLTGIMCGDTAARLTAATTVGPPFSGADAILTIGCRP